MRLVLCENYEEMSKAAAKVVASQIIIKPDCVLGFATGSTPVGMYRELCRMYAAGELDFSGVTTFNLDEYYPIAKDNPESYHVFMEENLFSKVNVPHEAIHIPDGSAADPEKVCRDYEAAIEKAGGIDLQILGIGQNGHIGFNEPDASLDAKTHVTDLTESTIEANILAIMSFTLNRVYTEWYRNKGYNFTITSSTAYDHKWIYGKTIYENISQIADRLYNRYLARPNVKQPILTQYCDGKRVSCPNWMTQWGSKALGDDGFSAIDIIHYYYGTDMYINEAEIVSGIPSSYPGYDLTIGSSGEPVITIQEQLNRIAQNYPAIPTVTVDGIYGSATAESVRAFQSIFNLPVSGIVDFPTWYKISQIYVGVSKIAENIV